MKDKRDTSGLHDRIVMVSKIKFGSVNKMLKFCNLPKSTVDNIKNGSMPSGDKLNIIATACDVSTDYLLTGNNPDGGMIVTIDKEKFSKSMDAISRKIQDDLEGKEVKKEPLPPDDRWKRYEKQINELPASSQERLMKQFQAMIDIEKESNRNQ